MGDLKLLILALALAVSLTAAAQEHCGSSYDWLSAGRKVYLSPYYPPFASLYYYSYYYPHSYPNYYHPYSMSSGFPDSFLGKGPSAHSPYPAMGTYPWIGQSRPLSKAWWIGLQQDWIKTLTYARAQSSVLVYRDGAWQPP